MLTWHFQCDRTFSYRVTHTQGHYYSSSPLTFSLFIIHSEYVLSYYSLQHSEGRQRQSHGMKSNKGILHVLQPTSCFVLNVWRGVSYAGALLCSKSSTSQDGKEENRVKDGFLVVAAISKTLPQVTFMIQVSYGTMELSNGVLGNLWLQHCIITTAFSHWPTEPSCTNMHIQKFRTI